jgi:hypothetical protein
VKGKFILYSEHIFYTLISAYQDTGKVNNNNGGNDDDDDDNSNK